MASSFKLTDSSVTNLFKIKYDKISINMYNGSNVVLGRVRKDYSFVGKQRDRAVPLSFQGGIGSGTLPTFNRARYDTATLTTEKVYAVSQIDRQTWKQSKNEGAFVDSMKEVVKKTVEAYNMNMSRILFNDASGSLGAINASSGVTDNGGGSYTLAVADNFKSANYSVSMLVNIESGNTDLFEITSISRTAGAETVTVQRQSGSQVPANGDSIYLQGSESNDPEGIKGILDATSGSKYGIPIGDGWKAWQKAAGGKTLTTDMLNEGMLNVEFQSGQTPNLIVVSYKQLEILLNQLEDKKTYDLAPRAENLKGKISFPVLQFMSVNGAVPIVAERFCDDDRVYFLNDNHIEITHAPDFGWFDDDGTVFLRDAASDSYSARYGGYLQTYIPPLMHGVISGLSTT